MGFQDNAKSACFSVPAVIIRILLMLAIPISMIVMGAKYRDDCEAEYLIPIYLIVMGAFMIVRAFISLFDLVREGGDGEVKVNPVGAIMDCFLVGWFIAGNVFIYRLHDNFQSHDTTKDDYCDYTLYWYAFWITTASYILMGAALVIGCIVIGCMAACS